MNSLNPYGQQRGWEGWEKAQKESVHRAWECYWEIFLILCVSSSHLPQQEMSEESWETFRYTHHFDIYTHSLTQRRKQMCAHAHSQRQEQKPAVAELSHAAPATSLKVRETITITYNHTSFQLGGKSCLLKPHTHRHTHNVNNFTEYSHSFSPV